MENLQGPAPEEKGRLPDRLCGESLCHCAYRELLPNGVSTQSILRFSFPRYYSFPQFLRTLGVVRSRIATAQPFSIRNPPPLLKLSLQEQAPTLTEKET